MQRIDRCDVPLSVEEQNVLQRLFPRAQDVDDVLRQAAAQERGHGAQLAAQVLEEAAQEFCVECAEIELQLPVALVSQLREEFQVRTRKGRHLPAGQLLELPKCSKAGEKGRHLLPSSRDAGEVFGEWRGICEEQRSVHLPFGHHFNDLVVFPFRSDVQDGSRGRLLRRGCDIRLLPLDHEVMGDQVCEYVPIESMQTGSIKRSVRNATGSIDGRAGGKIQIRGYCDVKPRKEFRKFRANIVGINVNPDSGVHAADLRCCSLSSLLLSARSLIETDGFRSHILAHMFLGHEELGSQVHLCDDLMVQNGQRPNSCQHQVLRDLVRQCLERNKKDIG